MQILVVAAFVGVLLLFLALYWALVIRPEAREERALAKRLDPTGTARKSTRVSLLNGVAPRSTLPLLVHLFGRTSRLIVPLERLVQQSNLKLTVGQLFLASLFVGALAFGAVLVLVGPPVLGIGVGAIVATLPFFVVRSLARRRLAQFEEQFPEAIDLIARALRAGHAFTTGLGMAAEELAEPARTEFRLLYDRQNYGLPLGEAMKEFAERVSLLDARFFTTAVITQREAGGNLAEILDNLANLIRERFKIRREVKAMSAHGRITGMVLGGLPFAIGAILYTIAPDHIGQLFTDPLGIRMVVGAGILQCIGVYAMRRIIDIEI